MYTISYHHTSPSTASTIAEAKREVRVQAIRVRESDSGQHDVVFVRCEDGLYAYLDQAAADADDTGVEAFAVISG